MVRTRAYEDGCPVAVAMDLLGERWSVLVVRELLLGPKRFSDLRTSLPGVSPDVLSDRLRGLAAKGVLIRGRLPAPSGVQVYELTEWGRELEPVILRLAAWALRSEEMAERRGAFISVSSLLLSLRVRFDPAAAAGLRTRIRFDVDAEPFLVTVENGTLTVERHTHGRAVDLLIRTDRPTLARLLQSRDLEQPDGQVTLTGDPAPARRLLAALGAPTDHDERPDGPEHIPA